MPVATNIMDVVVQAVKFNYRGGRPKLWGVEGGCPRNSITGGGR